MTAFKRAAASKPTIDSFKAFVCLFLHGFFMGAADVVPGVSGGTIAFLTGIYEDLIESIKSLSFYSLSLLFRFRFCEFKATVAWEFLLTLALGVVFAIFVLASFFSYCLGHEVYHRYLYALFIGLILASVVLCLGLLKTCSWKFFLMFILGVILAFNVTALPSGFFKEAKLYRLHLVLEPGIKAAVNYTVKDQTLDGVSQATILAMFSKGLIQSHANVFSMEGEHLGIIKDFLEGQEQRYFDLWMVFYGVIGVSAMLLPGISGSYVLHILGAYASVIAAIADLVTSLKKGFVDQNAFFLLMNLLLGIFLGAMCFSRIILWLFARYHDFVVAFLAGFMLGAIRSVWPFWEFNYVLSPLKLSEGASLNLLYTKVPDMALADTWLTLGIIVLAFVLVLSMDFALRRKKNA